MIRKVGALSVFLMCFVLAEKLPRVEFFPDGSYFKPILLDPATPQLGSSINSYIVKRIMKKRAYIPVLIGTSKIILRIPYESNRGFEAGFEYGVYSQFIIGPVRNMIMGGLENADYRISAISHYMAGPNIYRVKLFHQSSHLGDDHIIRNEITTATSNIQNYEELSIMYIRNREAWRYYISGGYNISIYTVRGRVLVQGGADFSLPLGKTGEFGITGGCDLKIYQQNNFSPNWKLGFGLEIGRKRSNTLRLLFEYYNGHLPYSTLEPFKVQMMGVGFYFSPIIGQG